VWVVHQRISRRRRIIVIPVVDLDPSARKARAEHASTQMLTVTRLIEVVDIYNNASSQNHILQSSIP
jgi:hypothetical protein